MAPPSSPARGRLVPAPPDRRATAVEQEVAAMQRRVDALALPAGCATAWLHTYDYAFATDGAVDVRSDGAWHSIAVTAKLGSAKLRHVAVPREQADVFRIATLGNPLGGPLLPGPIDVYDRGSFLITSEVDHTPAGASVEIGLGVEAARRPGSAVHDPIDPSETLPASVPPHPGDTRAGFRRRTNNAGGLEGGITTGEPLVIRVAMKPISTLMSPLPTVDLATGQSASAQSERSDVTAVPALGVIAEAVTAIVLADAMLEKFGGDSLAEMRRNYDGYLSALGTRWAVLRETAPD